MATPTTVDARMIEFSPHHVDVMDLNKPEVEQLLGLRDLMGGLAEIKARSEQSGTLVCDGRVICCTGFVTMWPGVGDCWTIPSIYMGDYAMTYGRTIRRYIDGIIEMCQYHRAQTACLDDEFHNRWMDFLGFKPEGKLEQYSSQKVNYRMYARIT